MDLLYMILDSSFISYSQSSTSPTLQYLNRHLEDKRFHSQHYNLGKFIIAFGLKGA